MSGTQLFLLGTTLLTLPSLVSTYYKQWYFHQPWASAADLCFIFRPSPHFQILSSPVSLFSHLFHHVDLDHWLSNNIALFQSALYLNLGFQQSSLLFLGGGLAGLLSTICHTHQLIPATVSVSESWYQLLDALGSFFTFPASSLSHLGQSFQTWAFSVFDAVVGKFPTTIWVCGSSASVFAFLGAEFVQAGIQALDALSSSDSRRFSRSFASCLRVAFMMALQIGFLVKEPVLKSGVGYAAHVGGFVFGAAFMILKTMWMF
jgi:membrane associated rhomboid family serine protease